MLTYDFGYSWPILYGAAIPLALAGALAIAAVWRRWPPWVLLVAAIVVSWGAFSLFVVNVTFALNRPMELPTPQFLASSSGRVLDAGAGSGRAAIGVLLARPAATVTGLDIYSGYWGIDDNTPERFMANARAAGVADRVEARTGDMRAMPFRDGEFDAVISSFAIDHLRGNDFEKALSEVKRVLKPGSDFLVLIVNPDWLTWLVSPPIAHHARPNPARWRSRLERGGFVVHEEGTKPATLYFLARKAQT